MAGGRTERHLSAALLRNELPCFQGEPVSFLGARTVKNEVRFSSTHRGSLISQVAESLRLAEND